MDTTREMVDVIFKAMQDIGKEKVPRKFARCLAENKIRMEPSIKVMIEVRTPLQDLEERRIKLCEKHADKDKCGNPIVANGVYQGLSDNLEFQQLLRLLSEEKIVLEKEIGAILQEPFSFEPYMINFEDFPEMISSENMDIFLPFISKDPK